MEEDTHRAGACASLDEPVYELSPEMYLPRPNAKDSGGDPLSDLPPSLHQYFIPFDCIQLEDGVIGRGFFGSVYKASIGLAAGGRKVVAAKAIKKKNYRGRSTRGLFEKEVANLAALSGPTQCLLEFIGISVDETAGQLYIITEYVNGGSLKDLIASIRSDGKEDIRSEDKLQILIDVAAALVHMHHRRYIHRDLNTGNILLSGPPERRAKLADFGLSRVMASNGMMTSATGALAYSAPEMLNTKNYSTKVDVYGFGLVLWELFTLHSPEVVARRVRSLHAKDGKGAGRFDAIALHHAMMKEIDASRPSCVAPPSGWKELVMHCCQANPDDRPDMLSVQAHLERMMKEESVSEKKKDGKRHREEGKGRNQMEEGDFCPIECGVEGGERSRPVKKKKKKKKCASAIDLT